MSHPLKSMLMTILIKSCMSIVFLIASLSMLAACVEPTPLSVPQPAATTSATPRVPIVYRRLRNPVPADEESLKRGQELYATYCAYCHGDTGMGDGRASQGLDPRPSPVALTNHMFSDGYLFWWISEGAQEFGTAMPAWKEVLDETARWDVVNALRSMDSDEPR
jgi:mono/diheme cytochrome c family protein